MLLQLAVFNNIHVGGFINPYIYPLILLLLPFDIAGWLLLVSAFFLGLIVDLFTGTLGLHIFASVFVAGIRPFFIKFLSSGKIDPGTTINFKQHGIVWLSVFISVIFFIHHSVYFTLESLNLSGFGYTILRIFASSFISVFLSLLLLFLFKDPNKK
ncbi:MAG: hypothetical protein KDC82_04840 [Bacteroidetes bacterium]|nr:hypothetical protein [Bacteroidota bacterium]